MRVWAWALSWMAAMSLWACGWAVKRSSLIRISAYGYTDPPGYGRRLSPRITSVRPRRNATFVVSSSEINIDGGDHKVENPTDFHQDEEKQQHESEEGNEGDETHSSTRFGIPINRRGTAASDRTTSRRKLRTQLIGPSRRSQRLESSTSRGRQGGFPPAIPLPLPPAPPTNVVRPPGFPSPRPTNIRPPAVTSRPTIIRPPGPVTPDRVTRPSPPPPGIIRPPSTPTPPTGVSPPSPARPHGGTVGPPDVVPIVSSPAPPTAADEAQVTDIKCINTESTSSFMAVLSLPLGYNAIPVFEDRPSVDPTINTACRMIPTQLTNDMFQLIVSDLQGCGVVSCRQPNGETWLCLALRFPLVNGLKLPEDEIIQIRCRPQAEMAEDTHVLTVALAKYAAKGAM